MAINKSAIYRELSAIHPARSAKSFEFKFQNISAILYEQKLSYVDGLRPMGNYQIALKTSVLNYLKQAKPNEQSPIDILVDKLRRLRNRDYLPIHGKGTGRYGLSLEYYLSIPQNSSKEADFMGIELKTKKGKSLQTLFSRVPSRYLACKDKNQLVEKFGYFDEKRNRQALYTSFNNTQDSLGFNLIANKDKIVVNKKKTEILEYDNSVLENALLSNHNKTAYVSVSSQRLKNGNAGCRFDQLLYCKTPSLLNFLHLANDGNMYLDFTLSETNGRVKDHGFLWRVPQDAIGDLYQETQLIDLSLN
ncbi:MAG TPA: hypothetical protein ENK70_03000 [Methylophaga sp.]|nr:hypothetical protein [Methylophaga sp.]